MKYITLKSKYGIHRIFYDEVDHDLVSQFDWYVSKNYKRGFTIFYAKANVPTSIKGIKTTVYMHRIIMNPKKGLVVDHINRNGLNNCRSNLRVCSYSNNGANRMKSSANKSGYKGVSWNKVTGKWRARIMVNRKEISGGNFHNTAESAARSYNDLALKYHGKFALLNQL